MAPARLEYSDLFKNKSQRIPVCFVIETSQEVDNDAVIKINIEKGIETFTSYIKDSLSLKSMADICIIFYGEEAKLFRPFSNIKDNEKIRLEIMGGEPKLGAALKMAIKEFNLRQNDYEMNRIRSSAPVLFIMSSGLGTEECEKEFSQISHLEKIGKMSVFPVLINDGPKTGLKQLTYLKEIYCMNSMNYESMFGLLGKSIETLSKSSASTAESLKMKSVEWDEFKRK